MFFLSKAKNAYEIYKYSWRVLQGATHADQLKALKIFSEDQITGKKAVQDNAFDIIHKALEEQINENIKNLKNLTNLKY